MAALLLQYHADVNLQKEVLQQYQEVLPHFLCRIRTELDAVSAQLNAYMTKPLVSHHRTLLKCYKGLPGAFERFQK